MGAIRRRHAGTCSVGTWRRLTLGFTAQLASLPGIGLIGGSRDFTMRRQPRAYPIGWRNISDKSKCDATSNTFDTHSRMPPGSPCNQSVYRCGLCYAHYRRMADIEAPS